MAIPRNLGGGVPRPTGGSPRDPLDAIMALDAHARAQGAEDAFEDDDALPPMAEPLAVASVATLGEEELNDLLGLNDDLDEPLGDPGQDEEEGLPLPEPALPPMPPAMVEPTPLPSTPQSPVMETTEDPFPGGDGDFPDGDDEASESAGLKHLLALLNGSEEDQETASEEPASEDSTPLPSFPQWDSMDLDDGTPFSGPIGTPIPDWELDGEDEEDEDDEDTPEDWGFTEDGEDTPEAEEAFSPLAEDGDNLDEEPEAPLGETLPTRTRKPRRNRDPQTPEDHNAPEKPRTSGLVQKLKDRLALVKAQVQADFHGDDIPTKVAPVSREDEDLDEGDGDPLGGPGEPQDGPGRPSRKKGRGKGSSGPRKPSLPRPVTFLWGLVKKPYLFLVGLLFTVLKGILGLLSKLPLVGRLFKPLLAATRALERLASLLPLVFLVGVLVLVNHFSVPSSATVELPDQGSAVISQFQWDGDTQTASGVIQNTGDVIASVTPTFTVHALEPGLNPLTWFLPKEVATCETKPVDIDIDGTAKVSAKCQISGGLLPRVSGGLK